MEESNRSAGRLWPFGKVTLRAQQMGAQRGAMMDEEGAGEEEDNNSTPKLSWLYGRTIMTDVDAELGTEEPDVIEDGVSGRSTSVMTKRRVQRGALSVITTQRTISTRQHPVVDETDPEVTFKHCQGQQLFLRRR